MNRSELEYLRTEAQEDLLAELQEREAFISEWVKDGEAMMARKAGWSIMFHIGQWWADRPWRNKEKGK